MSTPPDTSPTVVVLAAGASTRLGSPKALVEIGGASVLEALLDAAGNAWRRVVVVTGAHHAEIVEHLARNHRIEAARSHESGACVERSGRAGCAERSTTNAGHANEVRHANWVRPDDSTRSKHGQDVERSGRDARDRPSERAQHFEAPRLRPTSSSAIDVAVVHNERWSSGRTSSVQCAVRAAPGCDLVIAPVDVPRVPSAVFDALLRTWSAAGAPALGWLAPAVLASDGTRRFGHPVVIGRELAARLEREAPDRPLAQLRGRAEPLLFVDVDDERVLEDLDTPQDLADLRKRAAADRP